MFKKNFVISLLAGLLITGIALVASPSDAVSAQGIGPAVSDDGESIRGRLGQGADAFGRGISLEPLTPQEMDALERAILEEYGAYNLYLHFADVFESSEIFARIAQSEQQHLNALIRQAEKYGMVIPANPGLGTPPVLTSVEEACQAGVEAELADGARYDELMALTDRPDLIRVFTRLQAASLEKHLPAFEACLLECPLGQ